MVKTQKILFVLLLFCFIGLKQSVVFAQIQKEFECKATYYHNMFENRRTSSGEIFTQKKYTAAHKTLPMHTIVKVTNLSNGRYVLVKVNDRCPKKGVIDLSYIAAKQISLHKTGTARVKVEVMSEGYIDVLNQQYEIFNEFEKAKISDTIFNHKLDSLFLLKENMYNFALSYYVRLCSVENIEYIDSIEEQLPVSYKNMIKTEKVLNLDYYYVNIGPFLSINLAEQALKDLKSIYKSAYIVKKK